MNRRIFHRAAVASPLIAIHGRQTYAAESGWSFRSMPDRVEISSNGRPIATYVTKHPKIRRPFFQDVFTPGGMRVTRPIPPDPDAEDTDHDTMHPGLWLAFGDLNGVDYWRNKAEVRHVRYSKPVKADQVSLSFETENHWMDPEGSKNVCREFASYAFRTIGPDVELEWHSKLMTEQDAFRLGFQEEMGLGVRLTRPLTVKKGTGRIDCSCGGVDEKGTWGKSATWWAATIPAKTSNNPGSSNHRGGIRIFARFDPGNRPFWGHTRDYGLIVANPSPRPGAGSDSITIPSATPLEFHFQIRLFDNAAPDFEGKSRS